MSSRVLFEVCNSFALLESLLWDKQIVDFPMGRLILEKLYELYDLLFLQFLLFISSLTWYHFYFLLSPGINVSVIYYMNKRNATNTLGH